MTQETTISNADLLILARDAGLPITWWEKEPDREWRELRAFAGLVQEKLNQTQKERMTRAQREAVYARAEARIQKDVNLSWRDAIISETEMHHGITAPAGGEKQA